MPGLIPVPSALSLALRNLGQDRLRFALSVVGVGLALMLVLFLMGLREGALRGAVVYLDNAPGPVVVMPPGVSGSIGANAAQLLTPEKIDAVLQTEGVASITPVLLTMGFADLHGTKELIRLVGYDGALGGGPWNLQSGREPVQEGEVVLDRALVSRHGLRLGESFEVGGFPLVIVGLSNETSSWTGSYGFAPKSFVESLVLAPGAASFLLVSPDSGIETGDLVAQLGQIEGVDVLLKSEVMANDRQTFAGAFDQVILLMVGAAFVVGALVVGMVIYTATNERQAEYGILKAIGARSGVLYRIVVFQALATAALGALLGIAFTYVLGQAIVTLRPQYAVLIQPSAIAAVLAGGLVIAAAGALIPAQAVARLAPAEVFRR